MESVSTSFRERLTDSEQIPVENGKSEKPTEEKSPNITWTLGKVFESDGNSDKTNFKN